MEIIISFLILTVAMLGYSQIYRASLDSSYRATREIIATNVARAFMAEIMSKNFEEPGSGDPPPALGPDGTETRFGSNGNAYDDVDDYDYFESNPENPPVTVAGDPMDGTGGTPNYSDFSRSVSVKYVDLLPDGTYVDDPPGNTDYKKVTVTVSGPYVKDIIIDEVKAKPSAP